MTTSTTNVELLWSSVAAELQQFLADVDLLDHLHLAFGESIDEQLATDLIEDLISGDVRPELEFRAAAEINGANGAFAASTGKVYLAQEFFDNNSINTVAIVLLEELGHYLDSQLNLVDSAGDEGAIFANLVQGNSLDEVTLAALKAEDDSATVTLDGQVVEIEQAGLSITPAGSLSNLGWVIKGNGDIDGDGYQDFIASAPGGAGNTGELYIVFGNATGLTTPSTHIVALNSFFSPQVSLGLGDINNDGKDDIIIGDSTAGVTEGKTYVIFGDSPGSIATGVTSLSGTDGFTIVNSDSSLNLPDFLGWSVSSGDINGDLIDDVIIGDILNEEVYVVLGQDQTITSFPAVFDISTPPSAPHNVLTFNGPNGSQAGFSVASGNIGGSSADDLIIGAPLAGTGGETYVAFGGSSIATNTGGLTSGNGFIFTNTTSGAGLGAKVASAGDINGDNYEDLIVTEPGGSATQRTYVLFGGAGLPATIDTNDINGVNGFYLDGLNADDGEFEAISAAGDINNDGIDDLLITEPFADTGGLVNSGQVHVLYGKAGGFGFGSNLTIPPGGLSPSDGWSVDIAGLAAEDFAGFSVSDAGDLDGDLIDDFLIGAPGANNGGGIVYLLSGQPTDKPIPETTVDFFPSYVYGGNPDFEKRLIGENHKFVVTFDNVASSPGNVGGDPFFDLFLDTTGADGDDGFSLVGVKALSDFDFSIINTGGVDGVHTIDYLTALNQSIETATIYQVGPDLWVDHPYAGPINLTTDLGFLPGGDIDVGDTLHVIPLLTDSFAPEQEPLRFEVEVDISKLADYQDPNPGPPANELTVATRGGFRTGADQIFNGPPTDPIFDDTATDDSLEPQLFRVRKTFSNGFDHNRIITGEKLWWTLQHLR